MWAAAVLCLRLQCSWHDGGCFYTTRAVAIGEHLSCNYLGDYTRQMSTPARREALRDSKLFWCMCARCTRVADPDRHVPCPGCHPRGAEGFLPPDALDAQAEAHGAINYAVSAASGGEGSGDEEVHTR